MASVAKPVYPVQVRELVDFVLRSGDLGGERNFVGSDRALAGTLGHQRIQRSRPSGYQKEVGVRYDCEVADLILRIRGRIDGVLVSSDGVLLEEIKTVQGPWLQEADLLHWAQAKIYGFIYCRDQALEHIDIQLTYLELETEEVREFNNRFTFTELSEFFERTVLVYLEWIREHHLWCQKRNESIRLLEFPFPYRAGQRKLAVAAYRTLVNGGRLFLEAPTGTGKTISVLFPAMKALGEGKVERIFYLTARTVGRTIAEKAFVDMQKGGLQARTVTITAKEKVCVRDGVPCDIRTCPLARGYYDRRRPAMRETLMHGTINRSLLEAVGEKHQVCPFELSLDVSSWVDAVICDYNYLFDPKVYLRRHFAEEGNDYGFLVDESHNLVDRAREMYSADLDTQEINEVRAAIKEAIPRCAKALTKLKSAIRKLGKVMPTDEPLWASDPVSELNLQPLLEPAPKNPGSAAAQRRAIKTQSSAAQTCRSFPTELTPLVEAALKEAETWLVRNEPADFKEILLAMYFRLYAFQRVAQGYDERYVTILEGSADIRVRLFCLDPSFSLGQALARGKAAIFFSATLTPVDYYRSLLGGMPDDPILQLESPFPSTNLAVLIQDRIQTHFKARERTLLEVVESIGAFVKGRRGNYLVYLPSYEYLTAMQEKFRSLYPEISVLIQRPSMLEAERDGFLAAFAVDHGDTLVGFALLGGIFGEGIDLVGERLIGAVIVGVGLPQICVERDLIKEYFQEHGVDGFEYAYTYPGMNRVLQAIGRVIRSETDRGAVLLIDTRFSEFRYRRLFPSSWQTRRVANHMEIRAALADFWGTAS